MSIEDEIKKMIESKYGNVKNFSIQNDLPYTTVRSILERGVLNAKVENVIKMADGLGMKAEDLFDGESKNSITTIYNQLIPERQSKVYDFAKHQLDEQTRLQTNNKVVVMMPTRSTTVEIAGKLSAGGGTYNDKNCVEIVEVGSTPSHYDLAFQVTGDSMYPTFEDGEIVFVKETNDVYNGQIGAIEINEEAFIKKMYLENNRLRLVSLNTDIDESGNRLYPDFYADELDDLFVIGRVII